MAAKYKSTSFIKNTELIDGKFLEVNILPKVTQNINDELYVIESEYDQRPDLLAWRLYGSPQLWWVFAHRNPDIIVDPIRDFVSGTQITLPSAETVASLGNTTKTISTQR